jgi:hypothetical protein
MVNPNKNKKLKISTFLYLNFDRNFLNLENTNKDFLTYFQS